VQTVLNFGTVIIGIFSAIILFYTNSVLARGRRREFGLYNVLGMEKRHIGRVLFWETAYTALLAIPSGILSGVLFSKLMQLILVRMLGGDTGFTMRFDASAAGLTVPLFLGIFLLIFFNDVRIIRAAKPVDLLRAANEGEREPKSRQVLAALGVLFLAAGYGVSLMTKDAVAAILLFFVAVILVILGTYLSFTAFSIVFLKRLRKNTNYYYKTRHFAAVSGMLYRMKRNAAGLASICILSTMVLVSVSTTVSLYLGTQGIIENRYPYDISVVYPVDSGVAPRAEVEETARAIADGRGLTISDFASYRSISFAATFEEGELVLDVRGGIGLNAADITMVEVVSREGYLSLTGKDEALAPGEALAYGTDKEEITLLGTTYALRTISKAPYRSDYTESGTGILYLVVDSDETFDLIAAGQASTYGEAASETYDTVRFNLSGTDEDKISYASSLGETVQVAAAKGDYYIGYVTSKQEVRAGDSYSFFGGFFFLGMFLGFLFLIATVLIIYYKQVSEGWDDRGRFAIMGKVGMTGAEIRATIRQQVLTVFFLPLLTAGLHIAFAFPMIRHILSAFSMTDIALFVKCTVATFAAFAFLYVLVYLATAGAYYDIVGSRRKRI
jgi:putative ABC transport system permease protein